MIVAETHMLAKRQLAEFVKDAVTLEGINFTLPEIQALLDGFTVGGHRLSDQHIALNQGNARRALFKWIENDQFEITVEKVCHLHAISGKEESLEWGQFRSGGVTIAGTKYMPPKADLFTELFDKKIEDASRMPDSYDQAIHIFLTMARCQFLYAPTNAWGVS